MELRGEHLVCYSNKIKPVCLRKCLCDRKLFNKAYLADITATNIIRVLPTRWRRKPAGIDMERNYVTVTLCICDSQKTVGAYHFFNGIFYAEIYRGRLR